MDLNISCCWKRLLLFSLLVFVNGQTSGPCFTVTFPAVIESGSEAKLCASLLKPNESLVMNIYVVHGDQSTLLLQEKAEEEFHRCFNFKAPLVEAESVQRMKVELQGESFKMTEERKVMFRSYHPLTFIQTDKPIYIPGQTVPAVIESGSEAKLCASLLKPNESLVMNIYVVHGDQSTLLLQEKAEEEFHRCFNFKAPLVEAESVQRMKVELQGETFKMTEERKVMFRSYHPLTFIQTDKPIYIPGQTVNFRVVTMDKNFSPLDHELNPESHQGVYRLKAYIGDRMISHDFEVKKYVLPKFEVTVTAPETVSIDDELMAVEVCGKYTYGQPVSGKSWVKVCRDIPRYSHRRDKHSPICVNETTEMKKTGCAIHTLDISTFLNSTYNDRLENSLHVEAFGADLAPAVQILAYCVLPSENVVARSTKFDIEKCFKNTVSLQFSPAKAVPGEKNTLQLSAQPGSLCGLSAVDKSVLILKPGERLDTDKIFNMLPVQSVSNYPYSVEDEQECLHVRPRQALMTDNAYESLKSVGLKMATNLAVRVPKCLSYKDLTYHRYEDIAEYELSYDSGVALDLNYEDSSVEVTVRTVFPETWIWQLSAVGDSGSAQVPVTVPDTITSWDTEAFCLSSKGLGLAPPAQLTVFQPFFLELSLPYSIIRGEIFELKATVFNYLSKCIMVKVTPAASSDYTLKASSDDQYSSCLCANGRKTFKWILTPSVLGVLNITVSAEAEASQTVCDNEIVSVPERGRIDTVTRSLLVQAEGTEKTETYSWLLCPKGDTLSEEVDLTLPKDVIEGSARSTVSVIGDILGRALSNLHGLLRMPYGCGEQNMAVLSPNIYILQYLENTEQLTSAIRERATGFLKSGYQRQLNYRHNSGAYSTFGHGDENTWLTAFVLRSFGKAQKYIFIDPQIIQSAKEWLISRRDSDGCFIQQGRLFNNRMKGGVNDNVTMTAYITASLLELETPVTDPVVTKGLSCLKSVIEDVKNTYTTALLAYTFSLARDKHTRQQLFKKLEDVAISEGSRLHWSPSASADDSDSLAVEISSYVLLLRTSFGSGVMYAQKYLERVDTKEDHVIVYLTEIPKHISMNYKMQMKQVLPVKNLKPAVVKVYDYYQTSDQSETEYSFHCQ
ncbi:LOW QUALITY PROTEIN: pregnancy zone protein-like [Sinocyclocheilus rhinocerous]|uniref:LOW QUALITY PROTEIN: pregnancy zone protein-like n=1 Tax=Sinocyclocheilus rhinocerous TaxID=307959 RepID=UPI0007BA21E3|nr:PREDICTED: LOW QUALITY PROTEIN: pregnancy zone protein-like [Sinocyclocheilus rhinocerous]